MQRRALLILAGATALPVPSIAQGAGTLRLLVGFPPGGAVDVVARQLAEALRAGGRAVVVENKPGAAGKLAVDALLAAAPDGDTLMVMPNSIVAMERGLHRRPRFDLADDLLPVTPVSQNSQAIAVSATLPARTLREFLDWAKANPGKANFATPGQGTPFHFLGGELAQASGVALQHVPYRGGAQLMPDVISGQVASTFSTTPNLLPFHQRGQIRILAVSAPQRLATLPDVPTFGEAGFPGLGEVEQFGVFARAGTPFATLQQLAGAIGAATQSPRFGEGLARAGFERAGAEPQVYARQLQAESRRWEARIQKSGFKPDA